LLLLERRRHSQILYLGGNIDDVEDKQWQEEGVHTALSARTYIENVMSKLEKLCGIEQFHKANSPMNDLYHPETDDTPLLNDEHASKYRGLIGCANWIITLGRFSMAPREGHFKAMQRVFGYLRKFTKGRILIDPGFFEQKEHQSNDFDNWREFYPDSEEELPPDKPDPLGKLMPTIHTMS
jgi:hypothetical protein